VLDNSVRFHLKDLEAEKVAMGAFLSGGIDSSTLVGLLSQATGRTVKSFSVGFDEARYNEIYYARIAAARFRAEAHECFVQPKQALEAFACLGQEFDEPFGNSSAIPTHFCLKMARDSGIKVMFAGDGGDELFGGNERYAVEKTFMLYHNIPSLFRRPIDALAPLLPHVFPWRKVRNYVQKANQPVADRVFAYQLYMRDHAEHYFTDDFRAAIDIDFPLQIPREHYRRSGNISPLNRLLYMDLKLAIADNDLFKVNRMAESLGIQVRYPFLDKQVAAASGRVPAKLKVKGWNKRYIFKRAFENLLPDEIIAKKKHGFGLPTGDWLRSDPGFRELARSLLLEPRAISRGYFKRRSLEELFARHDAETSSYYGSHIWNFMMLELWHRNHMDAKL
jgi:asparagine synthase (glutamine-hydrolysing)